MLILASKSPRRKELLARIYPHEFLVLPSSVDESKIVSPSLEQYPFLISYAKGEKISKEHPDDVVLSADTLVLIDGKIFGKPKDAAEAKEMLLLEAKDKETVLTGFHLFLNGKELHGETVRSELILDGMTEEKIGRYILTGSPFDKAGGYGIQDLKKDEDFHLLSGSFENVMGLPIHEVKKALKKIRLL